MSQPDKTLPAGAWKGRATIPFIDGINAEKNAEQEIETAYGAGDRIGRFSVVKFLCRGAQSTLYLAEDRRQSRAVIKVYDMKAGRTTMALRKLTDLMRNAGCPSLMPILGYGDLESGGHYEIMPVYQQGTLENAVITEEELKSSVLPQLNDALLFLHKNHLVHNDIKPSNIFWKDKAKKEIVLGDYDCLTSDKDEKAGGTLLFMAPERIYTEGASCSGASDYCSLGLTLMTLLLGRAPLDENDAAAAEGNEELRKYLYRRWQAPVTCPVSLPLSSKTRSLLNSLVLDKPEARHDGEYIANWIQNGGIGFRSFHQEKEHTVIKGLRYRDKLILDIPGLIAVLGGDWKFGTFMLEQHKLDGFVRQFDGKYYRYCQQYAQESDMNAGLFKLMQTLRPSRDFYWRGEHYESLEDFVNRTEEQELYGLRDPFSHFCRARLISFYEKQNGGTPEQVDKASEIELIGRRRPEEAVKKLQISLQQKPDLVWHGETLTSPEDLLDYLEGAGENLDREVAELYESKAFRVWLDFIRHGSMLSMIEKQMMESGI